MRHGCRHFIGFGGVAAARLVAARAAGDIQEENNSFISAGASTS
jgi:hypothetical protein